MVIGAALTLAVTMALSRVDLERASPPPSEVSAAGLGFIDGRGVMPFTHTLATQMHVVAKDARTTFFSDHHRRSSDHCMFMHGQSVRVISTYDAAVHVANTDGCSAWLSRAWVSAVKRPATGLLK